MHVYPFIHKIANLIWKILYYKNINKNNSDNPHIDDIQAPNLSVTININ